MRKEQKQFKGVSSKAIIQNKRNILIKRSNTIYFVVVLVYFFFHIICFFDFVGEWWCRRTQGLNIRQNTHARPAEYLSDGLASAKKLLFNSNWRVLRFAHMHFTGGSVRPPSFGARLANEANTLILYIRIENGLGDRRMGRFRLARPSKSLPPPRLTPYG